MGVFDKIKDKAAQAAAATSAGAVNLAEWSKTIPQTLQSYADRFDAEEMWEKLKAQASKAGQEIVMMVLTMFYTIRDGVKDSGVSDVKMKDVVLLAGAIAYFVCPTDAIPDFVPGLGYSDDLAALTFAYKKAYGIFSTAAKGTAMEKTAELLGKNFDPDSAAESLRKLTK